MGKGNLLGEKGEGCIWENLKIIKFVGLDHLYLMIIENMKVIGKKKNGWKRKICMA